MSDLFDDLPPIKSMGTDKYAEEHREMFEKYAKMRFDGIAKNIAFRRVWGEDFWGADVVARIYAIESTPLYQELFNHLIDTTPMHEIWNAKCSAIALRSVVMDEFAKESARVSAIKELNVMFNVTVIDERGRTMQGAGMAAFYADVDNAKHELDADSATPVEGKAENGENTQ